MHLLGPASTHRPRPSRPAGRVAAPRPARLHPSTPPRLPSAHAPLPAPSLRVHAPRMRVCAPPAPNLLLLPSPLFCYWNKNTYPLFFFSIIFSSWKNHLKIIFFLEHSNKFIKFYFIHFLQFFHWKTLEFKIFFSPHFQ